MLLFLKKILVVSLVLSSGLKKLHLGSDFVRQVEAYYHAHNSCTSRNHFNFSRIRKRNKNALLFHHDALQSTFTTTAGRYRTGRNMSTDSSNDNDSSSSLTTQQTRGEVSGSTTSTTTKSPRHRRQYEVTVVADGKKSKIVVEHGESILNALERQNHHVSLNYIPHECRRGNCLTCAGRVLENSSHKSLRQKENGLAPAVAKELNKNSYILTCSSQVVGEGVTVEIGLNHMAWDQIWSQRLQSEDTRQVGREASAKTIRLMAQQNIPRWKRQTERILNKSQSKDDEQ